ncbi:hypothetical protein PROFUN_05759 [Planoprotostelium fungivorum]|uniref:Uncharacterized protein n=1 Tax=Planoprotostelium fungivorum TaxID=1890364 RepID=A0A2P6NQ05_9EUKA|nr:hypothetical protein PROFUN_05759 [Planoprotostelium fungivorum]
MLKCYCNHFWTSVLSHIRAEYLPIWCEVCRGGCFLFVSLVSDLLQVCPQLIVQFSSEDTFPQNVLVGVQNTLNKETNCINTIVMMFLLTGNLIRGLMALLFNPISKIEVIGTTATINVWKSSAWRKQPLG